MRKFIVSDLHGNGEVYDSIMAYLENISLTEDVELYINGDLIDRGLDSFRMLTDTINRIAGKKNIKINYLAGNHELMMYEALQMGYDSYWSHKNLSWYLRQNGGGITAEAYGKLDQFEKRKIVSFLDNLEIQKSYQKEMLDTKGVIVAHARASGMMKFLSDQFHMKTKLGDIKDDILSYYRSYGGMSNKYCEIIHTVWDRENFGNNMGMNNYTTIIGHTQVLTSLGYEYNKYHKVLNIDGGCADLAVDYVNDITVPLVELDFDNKELIINRFDAEGKQLPTHTITKDGIVQAKRKRLKI